MKEQIRGWWDVNMFILRILRPPSAALVLISTFVFLGGLVLLIGDLASSAWVGIVVGFLGLTKDALSLVVRWFVSPDIVLKEDDKASEILAHLTLTDEYTAEGYKVVEVVHHWPREFVARSLRVDSYLREHDVILEENPQLLDSINERLQRNSGIFEDALRCQFKRSRLQEKRFINEAKTCLGQDIFAHGQTICIFRGTYYHSFLTNELVALAIDSRGPRPMTLFRGSEHYPCLATKNGPLVLKPIRESLLANHIGVSTIIHTSDGQLVLWRQSGSAQQSSNRLAPTGSGSCDWRDWAANSGDTSLVKLLTRAMEREFGEESHLLKRALAGEKVQTRILGYFRWLRRGGKPEFVGISKLEAPWSRLEPNVTEVDVPEYLRLTYPAATLAQLRCSLSELLSSDHLSVPLWVNLTCLYEALETKPEQWLEFLGIRE